MKAPPQPASLNSFSIRSISASVTFPFHTIKGAVRYSDEGSANCASNVAKLSAVSTLLSLQPVAPRDSRPPAMANIKFLIMCCVFMVIIVKKDLHYKSKGLFVNVNINNQDFA